MTDPDLPSLSDTRPLARDAFAIVLADLQPPIVARSRTNPEASLRRAASVLVEGAGALGIPVLRSIIRLGPGAEPDTIEELRGGPTLIRSTVAVLDHDESRESFGAFGRPALAVGGVSTEVAVLHTVLGARRLGSPVHVLVDLCGSLNERTEQAAFRQMEAAGATLSSVASLLTGLVPELDGPDFPVILGLLSRLWAD